MCGVPYHSAESYIARLVAKGYKVAICEQMESPAQAKRIGKSVMLYVLSLRVPVMESSMLDGSENNFICTVCVEKHEAGVCFADISTGELRANLKRKFIG